MVQSLQVTESPVVGIVSQTLEKEMQGDPRFAGKKSYIMKAYAQWLQAAGARVVPLILGEPPDETLRKLAGLNAVLLPGGDGDYLEFGRFIYTAVKAANDAGVFTPLWGTCMGYENMASYEATAGWAVLSVYDIDSASLPLSFVKDPAITGMYGWLGADARLFEAGAFAYNSHHWSMDPGKFQTDAGLAAVFELTAISHMTDGRPIVASMESPHYPFFGTQYHPEKPASIHAPSTHANHSWTSIQLNQALAERFVWLARSNGNTLGNFSSVQREIIENYPLIVTETFAEVVYVFN
jgi:gamma-glutamyl hydrolase